MAGFSGWTALTAVVAGLRFAVLGAWPVRTVVAGGRSPSRRELVEVVVWAAKRVRDGRSGVLVLRGEAGIGKSALLGYLTEQRMAAAQQSSYRRCHAVATRLR
jgi:hypothetical protein